MIGFSMTIRQSAIFLNFEGKLRDFCAPDLGDANPDENKKNYYSYRVGFSNVFLKMGNTLLLHLLLPPWT